MEFQRVTRQGDNREQTADWSQLHFDLICRIATDHLIRIEDFVMGSSVCHSWYHAFAMVKEIWNPSGRMMPWLMLAEPNIDMTTTDGGHKGRRKLFNPSRDKCYNLMLPETFGRKCWGSDHGWVVTLGLDLEMYLFNPLTKVRQSLPSQCTFTNQMEGKENDYEWIRNSYVHQVRVFKMPQYRSDCHRKQVKYQFVVMAIHGEFEWLSYAKIGDPSWMPIHTTLRLGLGVVDVAYCNDMILMLCLGHYMTLNVVEGGLFYGPSRPLMAADFLPSPFSLFPHPFRGTLNMFESFGDLILVGRYKVLEDVGKLGYDLDYWFGDDVEDERIHWLYKTESFQVFKLDFHVKQWKEVKDLGDSAFFVGQNGGISVKASSVFNCRPNSIYFVDDEQERWSIRKGSAGHDMGIYSMEDGYIGHLYQGDDTHSKFSCPFWFLPKLS